MVGLVIVSHSQNLAIGVAELAEQMVQGKVALATAGGIDDPENPIGTDPMRVHAAVESVYSEDGVVVLMDLGSALLSAEMALEFLTPDQQEKVVLCEAPLVEGAMAAAVQAMVGGTLEQVLAEARGALAVKAEQLGVVPVDRQTDEQTTAVSDPVGDVQELHLTIRNRQGLHARPAAQFVATANRFNADITLRKNGRSANAKSINQVATLGVGYQEDVVVQAAGADAASALAAIEALAAKNFGEAEEAPAEEPAAAVQSPAGIGEEGQLRGVSASPGIAIGPVFQYRPRLPEVVTRTIEDSAAETGRLQTAVSQAAAEIEQLHQQARQQVGAEEAAIFEAHQLFLQDPDMVQTAQQRIEDEHVNAEAAWQQAVAQSAAAFREMDSAYMQARAADVEDVGARVLRQLMGESAPALDMVEPSVLLAVDLSPSDTARLDPQQVLAICTERGGATAHSAILARALGIPAVVGLGPALADVAEAQMVVVDGRAGELWLDPNEEQLHDFRTARDAWLAEQETAKVASQETAVTADGRRIEVAANIGGPKDVATALEFGAEGVGLFRTEFLFLDRQEAPSEAEQLTAYRDAAAGMGKRPLIIRTLDVGGDKPLPYLDLGHEENPFLGWRGIRFCLDKPDIFKPQLRAILRASVDDNGQPTGVKIMFPMIGTLAELRRAQALLDEARAELRAEEMPFDEEMEVGLMIEVPAAVAVADLLAKEADFFSVGTNDLTQYVMAADRGNANVAELAQALQPAVLRLIKQTVQAGHDAGIWVGMCGELAGNELAAPLLAGLGLDELSMSAPAIPAVKTAIRNVTMAQAEGLAAEVLALDSVTAVAGTLQAFVDNQQLSA